jgi:hypothetical protein
MRLGLSLIAIASIAFAIAWLTAGRKLTALTDRLITLHVASLRVSPVSYDGGGLVIGELQMTFGGTDNLRADLDLCSDASNQTILWAGKRSFILGPRTNPIDPSGRPEIEFIATPGDQLEFNARRSVLGWPTPFEINWLGGRSPSWKRYVYYRLRWTKRDGARLEMAWRYEQEYYRGAGWTEPLMMWNSHTGLIRVDIRPRH